MSIQQKQESGVGLIENIRHSPSLKIISVIFCNNWGAPYQFASPLSTSIVPLQELYTASPAPRSFTLEWIYSSGKRFIAFAQSMLSTFKSSQHSISSVTVYVRLCMIRCVSRSVCTYDSMYLDEMQCICGYAHISTRCI